MNIRDTTIPLQFATTRQVVDRIRAKRELLISCTGRRCIVTIGTVNAVTVEREDVHEALIVAARMAGV